MESVIAFAREGGLVLGMCNGFQVLCEAGLLPGALLGNANRRFTFRQVRLRVERPDTAFTRACAPGATLSIPVKHAWGRYYADEPTLDALAQRGQVVLRYAPGPQLQRLAARHRRRVQRGGQRVRADASPRARGRRAGRLLGRRADGVRVDARRGGEPCGRRKGESRSGAGRRVTAQAVAAPTVQDAIALGLTAAEYELVCEKQGGRPPNQVELAMYSLLWSEHCAYKHSRRLLRTLPTEGEHVVMGPGENAGAVDVGGGLACAFKVESHNHPSAVEPFQGAATGVGGILRDIFALGARPIAVLDSLRFGELSSPRARYLLDGAVSGIGHYGNSIGVPTVGGEVYFEGPYEHNCLVNAMALGLAPRESLVRSAAAGVGNLVVLFGASTGRDGIGGASVLASAELGAAATTAADRRPTVQVGDPFEEKKLLECSLALLARGLVVSLQDLGAAGLTSAASEMAAKGGVGIDLDVGRVPLRERGMEPFEVMVSESQERMLCVVEPADLAAVLALCERWEVNGAAIGEVTDSARMRVLDGERVLGDMPVSGLVDECPLYDLQPAKPARPCTRPRRLPSRTAPARARRCSHCSPAPTSPRAARCSSATTRSSSHAPCAAPSRPTPPCSRSPTAARWPRASTATAGASPPIPTPGPSPRCSSAHRTSRASGPSRWARPTT